MNSLLYLFPSRFEAISQKFEVFSKLIHLIFDMQNLAFISFLHSVQNRFINRSEILNCVI